MGQHLGIHTGGFDHRTSFCKITEKDRKASRLAVRLLKGPDDRSVGSRRIGKSLCQSLAGNRGGITLQSSGNLADLFQNRHDTANIVQIYHVIGAGRRDFADIGGTAADFVDKFEIQLDTGFCCHCKGVKDGI